MRTLAYIFSTFFLLITLTSAQPGVQFLQCLLSKGDPSISKVVNIPRNSSYKSAVDAYIQNPRFLTPMPRPVAVVAPTDEAQIQATLACSIKQGLQLRVRSGGHDFEAESSKSELPFVIMDLFNLRSITVDAESKTAWVETGADLGEVYYTISQAKSTLGFPAGFWSTVGSGGHISGGGYGALVRKYGLASDNVLDAKFMDVDGKILYRDTMGEDLFWALRGGGGGNFGIVLAWKLNLVDVAEKVTICVVNKTVEQGATSILHRWQSIAHTLPKELLLEVNIKSLRSSTTQLGRINIVVRFRSMYQGEADRVVALLKERFPELGMTKEACSESTWIEAVVQLGQFPAGSPVDILLNRTAPARPYTKQKSDYVQQPIPEEGLTGIFEHLNQMDPGMAELTMTPYGGRMSEISPSETPYPHRAGILYMIYEAVYWTADTEGGPAAPPRQLKWIRDLYSYLTPYVSKNPRRSYVNYRDYDLGVNNITGNTSYQEASVWGIQYFINNFRRLALVKGKVDPNNFFRSKQSIPPL